MVDPTAAMRFMYDLKAVRVCQRKFYLNLSVSKMFPKTIQTVAAMVLVLYDHGASHPSFENIIFLPYIPRNHIFARSKPC